MGEGRSIGGTKTPYYRESDEREAAKMLALMTRRWLNDNANRAEVDAAYESWKAARNSPTGTQEK